MTRPIAAVLFAIPLFWGCESSSLPTMPTAPTPPPPAVGLFCGVERWAVKTLSDPDVSQVNVAQFVTTTISALNGVMPHCSGLPARRTYAEEFQVYEVVGRVTFVRLEDDRDYHIAVADLSAPDQSVVTELADPLCQGAVSSPHTAMLSGARGSLNAMTGGRLTSLVGQTVRIRGVGFFDFDHRQIGRSRSCIELHPILHIERVSGGTL